jgi:Mrp family chromosome partitioning ATPase
MRTYPDSSDAHAIVISAAASEARDRDATAALHMLAEVRATIDGLTRDYVARCRREGRSWATIGEMLGVSRQSAHERFRDVG